MPTLADPRTALPVKLLLIGNSGTGKTGALASLAEAGYTLHILDFDQGLDFLAGILSPAAAARVEYEACIDAMRATPTGAQLAGPPKGFSKATSTLNKWAGLDSTHILVLDSLTFLSKAAFNYCESLNPGAKDKRMVYFAAQQMVEGLLALLYSDAIQANVIVTSHIALIELDENLIKGYPSSLGRALSPKIPRYFNTCLLTDVQGVGPSAKRVIHTTPTGLIDVKHIIPKGLPRTLPIESGLADFFKAAGKVPPQKGATIAA